MFTSIIIKDKESLRKKRQNLKAFSSIVLYRSNGHDSSDVVESSIPFVFTLAQHKEPMNRKDHVKDDGHQ